MESRIFGHYAVTRIFHPIDLPVCGQESGAERNAEVDFSGCLCLQLWLADLGPACLQLHQRTHLHIGFRSCNAEMVKAAGSEQPGDQHSQKWPTTYALTSGFFPSEMTQGLTFMDGEGNGHNLSSLGRFPVCSPGQEVTTNLPIGDTKVMTVPCWATLANSNRESGQRVYSSSLVSADNPPKVY